MHALKNRKAKQTKAARDVAARAQRRLGLSGTPVIHSPLDLWSEFDILGAELGNHPLGMGSYSNYENSVAVCKPHPRLRGVTLYEFPPERLGPIRERVAKLAFEATKEECLDLPGRTWKPILCEMNSEQRKLYKQMEKDAVIESDGNVSSAPLIITQIGKLQRITSGHLKMDDASFIEFDSSKLDVMKELLPELIIDNHKAVIFARFVKDIDRICAFLDKEKIKHVRVDGSTSKDASQLAEKFQTDEKIKVFVGNPAVAGQGLNLYAANSVIYYSNSYNLAHRWQSEDRTYRIGQTRKVTYYDLICANSIDEDILTNLRNKQDLAKMTVSQLKDVLEGSIRRISENGSIPDFWKVVDGEDINRQLGLF
jgi:SNF2 family DNA or RNA helicase